MTLSKQNNLDKRKFPKTTIHNFFLQ